jgi:G:T-mismatch repair DNA endonuclease (very short patch repair protein)
MPAFKNLTGQQFDRLTVLSLNKIDKKHGSYWNCKCICGNIVIAWSSSLKAGDAKSCGCIKFTDLTGEKFGYFTVLYQVARPDHLFNSQHRFWLCRCRCGKKKVIDGNALQTGHTKSCGCLKAEIGKIKQDQLDYSGQQFGNWTIINRDPSNLIKWIAECSCPAKNRSSVYASDLISGKSLSCGCVFNVYRTSRFEQDVALYVKNLIGKDGVLCNQRLPNARESPDILIPSHRLIIECNGIYWHSAVAGSLLDDKWRHHARRQKFEKLGYRVIFVWEDDWNLRNAVIKMYLRNTLRSDVVQKFDARKLTVVELDNNAANNFIELARDLISTPDHYKIEIIVLN